MMQILNVTASVLQFLREKIITGELKPGQKLNESSLSARLGISRPPIREAFRLLEKDHLAVNIARKGTYVTEISIKDFVEVFQTREMIECYAIDLLKASNIRNLPKVELALERALNMPMPVNGVDPEQLLHCIKVFSAFHFSLVESCGNSLLANIYHSISFNLARYQFIYFYMDGGTVHDSLHAHKTTFELITNGRYDQAKAKLKEHLHLFMELVKDRLLQMAIFSAANT
jgi:DNA-binding GntR family transcriptional regulator